MSFFSAIKKFFVGTPVGDLIGTPTIKIEKGARQAAPYKVPEPVTTAPIPPAIAAKKKPAAKKPAAAPKKLVVAKAVVRNPRAPKV